MAEASSRARLIMTKVEPQIRVLNTSARSARQTRGFRISDVGFRVGFAALTTIREATAPASKQSASEPGRGLRVETIRWGYGLCRPSLRRRWRRPRPGSEADCFDAG